MEAAFFSDPLEAEIVKDIRLWSSEILEKPSPYFNNIPPCPYAKRAWMSDRVAILFIHENNHQTLYSCISQWDDKQDIALIADLGNTKNVDEFHEYLDQLNQVISDGMFIDRDIWLMGFHPYDEENDYIDDSTFLSAVEQEYAIIFIQRLSKLQESADMIAKKGYYDQYFEEYDADAIFKKRENFYRRLHNGYET